MSRVLVIILFIIFNVCIASAQRIYDSSGYVFEITDVNAKEVALISLKSNDGVNDIRPTFNEINIPDFVEYEGDKYTVVGLESFYMYPVRINKNFTFKNKYLNYYNVVTNIEKFHIPVTIRYISTEIFKTSNINLITVDEENEYFSTYDDVLYSRDGKRLLKWPKNKDLDNDAIFPAGVETLAPGAFLNMDIESIDVLNFLPATIVRWEDNCFTNIKCKEQINNFRIPEGVKYIGAGIIDGFQSEINGKISIPASLQYMSDFHGYDVRKGFDISADNTCFYIVDNSLINRNNNQLCAYWDDLKSIDYCYMLPASIKSIGRYALSYTKIKSIIINNGDVELEPYSLVNADLENVTLPAGLDEIPEGLLCATKLTSFALPDNIVKIGKFAFADCLNLSTLTFNPKLQHIGDRAFENCTSISSITCNSELCEIGDLTFFNCTSLKNIYFNSSISSVGFMAFTKTGIEEFTWPASLVDISDYAFYFSGLKKIFLPESRVNLGYLSFAENRNLHYINTGNTIEEISGETFASSYVNPNESQDDIYEWYEGNTFKLEVVLGNNIRAITTPFYSAAYGCINTAAVTPPEIPWANPYNPFRSAIDCIFYTVYVFPEFKELYVTDWDLHDNGDKWPGELNVINYNIVQSQPIMASDYDMLQDFTSYDLHGNRTKNGYKGICVIKAGDGKFFKVIKK